MNNYITPPTLSTSFSESGKSAKKRFDNILNTKAKKVGVFAFVTVICVILIAGGIFKHKQNAGIFESETFGFSISIPHYWEGKYGTVISQDSITFYHIRIRQKYGEGTGRLFTIRRLDGIIPKKEAEDMPWPTKYLMQSNNYTYVMEMPSDLQYPVWKSGNRALANEYMKMAEEIAVIENSIRPISNSRTRSYSTDAKLLFELKDTYIGDAPKVRRVAGLSNFADLPIQSIELKTDSEPYAITVNFKVDSRASYRFFDYSYFDKSAAVIFSLITNTDEIHFRVYDSFTTSDYYEPFISAYYTRQNLFKREGMEYFIDESIINAASSIESFSDYLEKVSAVNSQTYYEKERLTQIYNIIGDDCEITVNSQMSVIITITKEIAADQKLNALLEPKNIHMRNYIGKKIEFSTYNIRNFKTNQSTGYFFAYDEENLIAYEDLKDPNKDREVMDVLRTFAD